MNVLKCFKLHPEAQLPTFGTDGSACFDIRACLIDAECVKYYSGIDNSKQMYLVEDGKIRIRQYERVLVPTGLIFDIPPGFSLRIHPRSGLAFKNGLCLANQEGIVDYDYVEQSYCILTNIGPMSQEISHGDRIVQGELVHMNPTTIRETIIPPVQKTTRDGGFGSTGNN